MPTTVRILYKIQLKRGLLLNRKPNPVFICYSKSLQSSVTPLGVFIEHHSVLWGLVSPILTVLPYIYYRLMGYLHRFCLIMHEFNQLWLLC